MSQGLFDVITSLLYSRSYLYFQKNIKQQEKLMNSILILARENEKLAEEVKILKEEVKTLKKKFEKDQCRFEKLENEISRGKRRKLLVTVATTAGILFAVVSVV